MQKPRQSLFVLTSNPISKLTLYGIRVLFPVKTKNHRTYTGVWWRENRFLITVAIGSTIEMKLAQLTLHAPPAIIKDCKQMPKRPHFLFWRTYGAVFDLNFWCPVEGMLYSRALSPSTLERAMKSHTVPSKVCRFSFQLHQDHTNL